MKSLLVLSILFMSIGGYAQGILKSVPKPLDAVVLRSTTLADSTYTTVRPEAMAAYGYSKTGGSTLMAFAGIGVEHGTYNYAKQSYYTNWAVSLQIGTGASNGSVSLQNATTIGLFGSFFNNLLVLGIGYNLSNKNAIPLAGAGVAFH